MLVVNSPTFRGFCQGSLALALVFVCTGARLGAQLAGQNELELQGEQKKVLVLYSTGREAAISITGERDLPRALDRGLDRRLDFHSEYLDAGRFPDQQYQAGFRDFLRLKYGGQRFDAVIAVLDVAVQFVAKYRDELFPGTPAIFFARNKISSPIPNSTGIVSAVDFGETVRLATALQPEVNQVFVVSGAAARDRAVESQAREQLGRFEPRLEFTYFSGLPTTELERRLRVLPERSIVYYLLVYQDGDGQSFQPVDYLDRIAPFANRPTYSWVDSTIDHGVVGGSLENLEGQVAAVAALALRVLHGEAADRIPVSSEKLSMTQVDWRQLRRWGISEARVPPGAIVSFRDVSVWEQYRAYIVGAGLLLFAQAALIAGLLLQAARRRRAEELVRRNQAELRNSYQRISDLGRRLLVAQEAERSRISHELHDDVSQQVALLAMDLQILSGSPRDLSRDDRKLAGEALERAHAIAKSVHDLSHRLHPGKLKLIGIVGALKSLQRTWPQTDIALTFSHDNVPSPLPDDLSVCVYRVVQEALQNAVKHSGARELAVHLEGTSRGLVLTIADDGKGFDVDAAWGTGLGLSSMNERLQSIGGALTIHSTPGGGTTLEASVPSAAINAMEQVADVSVSK